ncbi:hypothetical protein D9M68_485460 [compost metagenome]
MRYSSLPSASSAPEKSPATCLRAWSPTCSCSSRTGSAVGRLLTTFTTPPGPLMPYSTDDGPRSSSMRSAP